MYNLEVCKNRALRGELQNWVLEYLAGGEWANIGLRDGLLLSARYWIGPQRLALTDLERCCGPEEGIAFRVPYNNWANRTSTIAAELNDVESLPPLIVEWDAGRLIVRDGNHRHQAMTLKGWKSCFAVVWCNSEHDHAAALKRLCISS